MRLRALLETSSPAMRLLGGAEQLDRPLTGVMTTDLRDPSRYLKGGELVLSGLAWRRGPEDSEAFVRRLVSAGAAALAAGEAETGPVPEDLITACARHRLPLFAVGEEVAFATITEYVTRQVSGARAGDLAAVLDRHQRLVAPGPGGPGTGPEAVLELLRSDLDLCAWVLSPTGRLVAAPPGDRGLPARARTHLAGRHLAAARAGRTGPHHVRMEGTSYSLVTIEGTADHGVGTSEQAGQRTGVLADWLLAVRGDTREWPAEHRDLLHGAVRLLTAERDRRTAARTVHRRLAQEVLGLLESGAPAAETAARLRVAAPVLLPGVGSVPHWQVVVARLEEPQDDDPPSDDAPRAATRSGQLRSATASPGVVARAVLEELLAEPGATGPEHAERCAVAHTDEEAVALVPVPAVPQRPPEQRASSTADDGGPASTAGAPGQGRTASGLRTQDLLSAVEPAFSRGLADGGRLTLGISAVVDSADGLHGALETARHARRAASARPGPVCAVGHAELSSHVLLLPFVPDDVRRAFSERLLGPLRAYDRRNHADLVDTVAAFLRCDGSWTRCAQDLHVHVNTLRYRIGRVEQLTGRDLSRLEARIDFFLALRMAGGSRTTPAGGA